MVKLFIKKRDGSSKNFKRKPIQKSLNYFLVLKTYTGTYDKN